MKPLPVSLLFLLSMLLFVAGCQSPGASGAPDAATVTMVEVRLESLAAKIAAAGDSSARADAFAMLGEYLAENPGVFGAALAFAPVETNGEAGVQTVRFSPYVFRSAGRLVEKDLAESYDYVAESWYARPVALGGPTWSEPYFDEGGGDIWMITYSIPVYDSGRRLIGVVTSDLPISPR